MSELVWGLKNGDLEHIKDIVENKVILLKYLCKKNKNKKNKLF